VAIPHNDDSEEDTPMKVEDIAKSHYPDLNATVNEIDEPRGTATPNEANRGGKKSFKKVGGVQGKCQT